MVGSGWAEDGSFNVVLIGLEVIEAKGCIGARLSWVICVVGVNWEFCGLGVILDWAWFEEA